MVCDNNYVIICNFIIFIGTEFVTSPRMVLKLTCNKVPVFTCSLIARMHVYVRLASFTTKPRFRSARLLILS